MSVWVGLASIALAIYIIVVDKEDKVPGLIKWVLLFIVPGIAWGGALI
jgi:hypothetical protein